MGGLIWLDGFDDMAASEGTDALFLSSGYAVALAGGGYGGASNFTPHGLGRSFQFGDYDGSVKARLSRALGYEVEDVIFGHHFFSYAPMPAKIVEFSHEDGLGTILPNAELIVNSQLGITLTDHGRTVVYAQSAANILPVGAWAFIEGRVNLDTNRLIVRVNGDEVINSICLAPLPYRTINMMEWMGNNFGSGTGEPQKFIDNLYILDGAVGDAPFNDFLGEIICYTSNPNGDVGDNDWVIEGSVDPEHYKAVDETYIDDSDYLHIDSSNVIEMFSLTDLPADTLEVLAVVACTRAKKEAGGPASLRTLAKIGGGSTVNLTTVTLTATPTLVMEFMETKPDASGAWTISDANALQTGFESMD